jgi:uncharacterized protein YdiU (UPF0061 family)
MLREVLIGEAMHALGIPTTRALAVGATGEPVLRETVCPGAVLTRVAASHIRVGTFQFFAARGDVERVRQLAEYTIARHDPGSPARRAAISACSRRRRAAGALIAQWMNVGFIHGVMNTDNMAISARPSTTAPCAFVETYDPAAVFSSIDTRGRYAYGNQPASRAGTSRGWPRRCCRCCRRRRAGGAHGDAGHRRLCRPVPRRAAARAARQARPAGRRRLGRRR